MALYSFLPKSTSYHSSPLQCFLEMNISTLEDINFEPLNNIVGS